MGTFAQQNRRNQQRAIAAGGHSGKSITTLQPRGESPQTVAHERLRETLNQSPTVQTQLLLQRMFDQSPRVVAQMKMAEVLSGRQSTRQTKQAIQRQGALEEEEPLQGKSMAIQKEDMLEDEEPRQAQLKTLQREIMPEDEEPLQSKPQTIQKFDPEKEKEFYGEQADKWRLPMPWESKAQKDRDAILKKVLKETYALLDSPAVTLESVNKDTSGVTPKGGEREDRTYRININTGNPWGEANQYNPTENRIRSIIMHELTHVAADQTYRFNDPTDTVYRAFNVDTLEEMRSDDLDDDIRDEITRIEGLVDNDPAFDDDEKEYVKFRLNRARSWQQELDTVANELLYYFDLQRVSSNSPTSIAITRLAEGRYARRSARKSPIIEKEVRLKEQIKDQIMKQTMMELGGEGYDL